ncbi:MAG: universal stress protein [Bacteroidetes bacterium]|nr:MAG: universal stress protein [Bacteroidota bacterium]
MNTFECKRVLVATDFSEASLKAVRQAAFIAQRNNSIMHLLHVVDKHYESFSIIEPLIFNKSFYDKFVERANEKINQLAQEFQKEYNIKVYTHVTVGSISEEILEVSKSLHIDLIVMGTHGYKPLESLIIGSNAYRVLSKSKKPVLVLSEESEKSEIKKILMPLSTSVISRYKVNYTLSMARVFGADVTALMVIGENEQDELPKMKVVLKQIEKEAERYNVSLESYIKDHVQNGVRTIIDFVKENKNDLVVLMDEGDAQETGIFFSIMSQQIIHHAPVPVLSIYPEHIGIDPSSVLSGAAGI